MKKIYLLLSTVALSITAQAQLTKQSTIGSVTNKSINSTALLAAKTSSAAVNDTVGWTNYVDFLPEFNPSGGQLSIFGDLAGGFIYGKNTQVSTCGQGYYNANLTNIVIEKVVMWAARKDMAATPLATSNMSVSIWNMGANKARSYIAPVPPATSGTFTLDSYGPKSKVGSTAVVNIANIDTTTQNARGFSWTIATFPTPVIINTDFVVVANCFGLAATDTVGYISDASGSQSGLNMTFHATAGGSWYKTNGGVYAAGALDNSIAFFPVLGLTTAVSEYVNGVKLSALYPNPTKDVATISYSLEKVSNNVSLEVFTVTGQKVYSQSFGTQQNGDYKISLDASSYSAGSYFYQLRSNGGVITKEFIVTK